MPAAAIKILLLSLSLITALSGCGLYTKDDWPSLLRPESAPDDGQAVASPEPVPPPVPAVNDRRGDALVARLIQHGGDFDRLSAAVDGLIAAYRADADELAANSPMGDWNQAQIGLSRLQGRLFEVKRLRAIIAEDVARGVSLLAAQGLEGAVLDGGRLYGRVDDFYRDRQAFALAQSSRLAALRADRSAAAEDRQALVVIHFTAPDVAFEDGLATAVEAARRGYPDVAFEVTVAVPSAAPTPESDAALQRVLRALMDLDVEPAQVSHVMGAEGTAPEVRIYVK